MINFYLSFTYFRTIPPPHPSLVFRRVITERGPAAANPAGVKRLIYCSGKVYYDLAKAREAAGNVDKVAISRIEQVWFANE